MKKFIFALMGFIIGLATTSAMGATVAAAVGASPEIGAIALDGVAFYTRNDAQNHANTLKNRELFRRTRGEEAAEDAEEQKTEQKTETGEE